MKKVTIKATNISPKQWSTLLLELNLMTRAWKPFANLELETRGLSKILKWGQKTTATKDGKE